METPKLGFFKTILLNFIWKLIHLKVQEEATKWADLFAKSTTTDAKNYTDNAIKKVFTQKVVDELVGKESSLSGKTALVLTMKGKDAFTIETSSRLFQGKVSESFSQRKYLCGSTLPQSLGAHEKYMYYGTAEGDGIFLDWVNTIPGVTEIYLRNPYEIYVVKAKVADMEAIIAVVKKNVFDLLEPKGASAAQ